MAIQNIGILDTKKKKKAKPRVEKLIGPGGATAPLTPVPTIPKPAARKPVAQAPTLTPQLAPVDIEARAKREAEFRQPGSGGLAGAADLLKPATVQPTAQVAPVATGPTSAQLQQKLLDASSQRQLNNLKAALARTTSGLQAEEASLAQPFRQAQAGVRTADTMARAGQEKFLSGRGLGDAGAVGQSDISQNIITQGAVGALNEQEIALKADIKRRLSQAEADFATGVLDAQSQTEMAGLQRELESITAKENAALKQTAINDQREYDLFTRELDKKDSQELSIFENDIKRENTILDADIQAARDSRQFGREAQLVAQKASNSLKLQAVKDSAAINRIREKGTEDRLTDETQVTTEAAGAKFDDKTVGDAVNNAIEQAKSVISQPETKNRFGLVEAEAIPFTAQDEQRAVKDWIVQNADDLSEDQGDELIRVYNLDEAEIASLLQGGISPGGQ
jgi:hypothetical protein